MPRKKIPEKRISKNAKTSELHHLMREVFKAVIEDQEVLDIIFKKSKDMIPVILRDKEVTEVIVKKFKNVIPGLLNDKEVIDIITEKSVKVLLQRKELLGGLVAGLLQKTKGLLGGLLGENDE